ncbi:MAG TPA: serine hydrolase domain-containing protein [Phototrophicaceae bacterium]|nr:serine hydrolase domain-containing protein [Phototrophicaceae bacterium]
MTCFSTGVTDIQTNVNHLPDAIYDRLLDVIALNIDHVFPAVAIAVIHRGRLVLDIGSGVIDPANRSGVVTPATRFDMASVTKLFTTTAFLERVSAGKAALDDPIVTVIPEFGAINPRGIDGGQDPHSKVHLPTPPDLIGKTVDPTRVTFRHLLTHTSGLPPWRDVFNAAGPAPTPPDQPELFRREDRWARGLQAICAYPFVGEIGSGVRYSDLGLMLLGEAVMRLWSQTPGTLRLDQIIRAVVCDPLGLRSPIFNPVRSGIGRMTIAPTEDDPTWRKRRIWGEVHDENACGVGGIAGHAGLFANAGDIADFGQAWLSRDARLNISPDLMIEASKQQVESNGERRGLGWMIKGRAGSSAGDKFSANSFGHTGFTGTSLWIDPTRELVVATLTNRVYPGRAREGILPFRRAVHDTLADLA